MLRRNRTSKAICVVAVITAYFALAEWSKKSFVDRTPQGRIVVRLTRPFERYGDNGVASYQLRTVEPLEQTADFADDNGRSPVLLYEDDRLLGPAHSSAGDIAALGQGRYSHEKGKGFLFSSSDKSDPNYNARSYWAVIPQ